ncbi:MAG: hypothetical protein GY953_25645 [bacterium]|nr:hypothetical protein [bacterium]
MRYSRSIFALLTSLSVSPAAEIQKNNAPPKGFGKADQTIEIVTLKGQMKYDRPTFTVYPGKKIKLVLRNADDMHHASWDIVTAGGYLVTGFGTTYFGGHRDPGPFDVDTPRNDDWEEQIGHIRRFFSALDWWRFIPADELISCSRPRDKTRSVKVKRAGRDITAVRPAERTYWAMADPGEQYIIYVRGLREPVVLAHDARAGEFRARQYNPRTGEFTSLGTVEITNEYEYTPLNLQDWVLLLERQ